MFRLVSLVSTEGRDAPAWQGVTTENIEHIRERSNAARRDAARAEGNKTYGTRHSRDLERVTITHAVEAAILAHARRQAPEECCGLLLGTGATVVEAVAVPNVAENPIRRYQIDPRAHLRVVHDARRRSLDVIGAYHSHPRSMPVPSETDRAEGFSGFYFLIAGLGVDPPELRAWIWTDGNFTAVPFVRHV